MFSFFKSKKGKIVCGSAFVILIIVVIFFIVYFVINSSNSSSSSKVGAVVTNGKNCANIGKTILEKGGKAVDAAIASLFCEGVSMAQSCGLGGGFLMTIYEKKSGKVSVLNAREVAPAKATEDMFHGNETLSSRGILSAAVPAELRGYWRAYKKFGGGVPWKDLVQPTIDLLKKGILVTPYLEEIFAENKEIVYADVNLRNSYIDPKTNNTYKKGQVIKRPKLVKTLEIIADEGGDALHYGSLTDQFVEDIKNANGIISKEDITNYEPLWQEALKINMPFGETLYTVPIPGSGALLAYMLNISQLKLDFSTPNALENLQRTVETFKFAYGMRTRLGDVNTTEMKNLVKKIISVEKAEESSGKMRDDKTSQDPEYYDALVSERDDRGTAHISVLSAEGDAVSVTSTINNYFGSGVVAEHSNIILNDQMEDFDISGGGKSEGNCISPGKRPFSSMSPAIIVNSNNEVSLVIGAAGGKKITSVVASVIVKHLWYNMTLEDSIDSCRIHHQLFPMKLQAEKCYDNNEEFKEFVSRIGHEVTFVDSHSFSAVTAISKRNGLSANFDKRRPGNVAFVN